MLESSYLQQGVTNRGHVSCMCVCVCVFVVCGCASKAYMWGEAKYATFWGYAEDLGGARRGLKFHMVGYFQTCWYFVGTFRT